MEARKPDFAVSRSERSALVSNQAAEHELRTALRSINNMKQAAAQAHAQQVHQFLESISDDVFTGNVTSEVMRRKLLQRRNSRSMDDITLLDDGPRKPCKRPDILPIQKSSSQELPIIQRKSSEASTPTKSSPRDAEPFPPRRQLSNGKIKRMSHLTPPAGDASSCPNSPLISRKKKAEKLDINIVPTTSGRVRCSSFTRSISSEGRVRTSSFTSTSPTTSGGATLPSPRKLRAQVEKNIQSNLEAARKEAARNKRLMDGKDRNAWEDQIARDQIERSDRLSSDSEEEPVANPYSISSSMKICGTPGRFEKQTGKQGLKAWMGKPAPKTNKKK